MIYCKIVAWMPAGYFVLDMTIFRHINLSMFMFMSNEIDLQI